MEQRGTVRQQKLMKGLIDVDADKMRRDKTKKHSVQSDAGISQADKMTIDMPCPDLNTFCE